MKEKNKATSPQLNSSSNSQVTQPVGDARNVRRNQQIKALHLEFEDLKKKIKDVQSKNEKIIQNIHKQYDFKKKPANSQYSIDPTPIVDYDQHNEHSHLTIIDNQASDQSETEQRPRQVGKKVSVKKNVQPFHQSVEYRKTENYVQQRESSEIGSKTNANVFYKPSVHPITPYQYSASQFAISPMQPQEQLQISPFNGMGPFQIPMGFQNSYNGMSMSQAGSSFYGQANSQVEDILKRERDRIKILQNQLQSRQSEIAGLKRIQKKYINLSNNYSETVQSCLEQFFTEVVEKRLYQMEKYVKKSQNKLRKIQLKLKDHQEHQRSQRNILEHRSKRSRSRSKKQASPSQNYNSTTSVPRVPSNRKRDSVAMQNDSSSKSKQSQSKSSQQFQEIANQYQQIIKIKTKQVETYEIRFRQKEKELIEMTAKCAKLEMQIADISDSRRRTSEKEENLLSGTESNSNTQKQVISLNRKINELEQALQKKEKEMVSLGSLAERNGRKLNEYENKLKKNELQMNRLKQECKRVEKERNNESSLSKLQSDLQLREKQFNALRDKAGKLESEKVQKECQNITLFNKIKKIESLLALKEQKVVELEKIIQSSVGGEGGDLLQKSMYLERVDHNDLQSLQEQKEKLQDELTKQRQDIFILSKKNESLNSQLASQQEANLHIKKQLENLQIQNQSMRINIKAQSFKKIQSDSTPLKTLLEEEDALSQDEEGNHLAKDQLEQLKVKHQETQKALKLQNQKTFQENRKVLKLTSELKYFKQQLGEREDKYERLRKQFQQTKYQINSLTQSLQEKESELEVQRKVNAEKIKEIQAQWIQFEQEAKGNNLDTSQDHNELRSSRFSEESFVNYRNTYNHINAENQKLLQKLKQLQKIVEVQKEMQEKIVKQYRSNVEKIKGELRDKNKQNERLSDENEGLKRKVRLLEQNEARLKQMAKGQQQQNLLGNPTQKRIELQMQVQELRGINNKLQAMEQQLFNQLSEKEKEAEGLYQALLSKDKKIEELQNIIEMRQMNFSSHISTSQHKSKIRQSLQSQSSLRYSMLSNRDKTMELQLSEAGQSFFDHNQSMISNVSQVFGRQEFPYQKMQLKRVEQRRLFEKTAAYIKSLKHSIDQKNKKIKVLERKIQSLRNSQLIRKDIYEIKESNLDDLQADGEVFKDYYSVQLESSTSQRYKLKQLEHQTRLTIEQNNLLNNQIQSMQEELLKAQQQENSLMKLKDLYKDEIKNLIKQNQDQIKLFEDQLKKERQKVEQSQSVQKMEAIKQVFLKIINTFVSIEAEIGRPKKKEQKKKELEDYLKVCCNLMSLQSSVREQMTASIREMRR